MGAHSLCIAKGPFTRTRPPKATTRRVATVIPVLSTFVVRRGVYTNRITERRRRQPRPNPSCRTLLRHLDGKD